jgi:ribose 5-phosphate isomerase B
MDKLRIVIGCDDAGYEYKEILKRDLLASDLVESVVDVGVGADGHTPYPRIGVAVGQAIASGDADRGLVICGTGMGVALAAGKV